MLGALKHIRREELRDTLLAFASLFAFMSAHALLETARDALFLARIPATQLPLVYIAVAIVALAISGLQGRSRRRRGGWQLAGWMVLSALVTLGFWPFVDGAALWVLYALYVWSAVVATVVLARFFLLLGDRFTVTQAKRLYAFIGAGSVAGAIAGSALAGVLSTLMPARNLLMAAALMLAVSAVGPVLLDGAKCSAPAGKISAGPSSMRQAMGVMSHPYARRVAALVIVATMTFTIVDYVFKSQVTRVVEPSQLGYFFARVYLALNILSLMVQLLLVRPLVRALSLTGSLAVLPALFVFGGIGVVLGAGMAAGGGLVAALALKGADGGLRHSLHRTVSELLYVPMNDRLRSASKTFIDMVGQRGGQALASLAIVGAVALGVNESSFGVAIVVLAALWIALAIGLRGSYLKLFRTTLADAAVRTSFDAPALDLSSLEAMLAALNSSNDAEVRSALTTLDEQGRVRLIPALILYHPSPDVVTEALEILSRSERADYLPITDRLLDHEYAEVRAATLRVKIRHAPDEALLREKTQVNCPVVRATALVGMISARFASIEEIRPQLDEIMSTGSDIAKAALARAIWHRPSTQFDDVLLQLSRSRSQEVRLAVVRAMAAVPSGRFLPPLLQMLAVRELRSAAREALVNIGETAFGFLVGALIDVTRPLSIRRHLPRTIMLFEPARAARALLEQLTEEPDGVVRYKILRALGRISADNPELGFDSTIVQSLIGRTISRAYRLIDWHQTLKQGREASPERATEAQELLLTMLKDKETNAVERIFHLLGLHYRSENCLALYRGLKSRRADVRASSRELLESFLPGPLGEAVLGLVDDAPDDVRLRSAGRYHSREGRDYNTLLMQLLKSSGESIRSLTVYHIGELQLDELRPSIEALVPRDEDLLEGVLARTIALLGGENLLPAGLSVEPSPEPAE